MFFAFDTIMQCKVSADEVSKYNIDEPFRYECLCCGEEVHIAAVGSRKRGPHFRHLHGNSDQDCELYLGGLLQTGTGIESAISVAQKRAHSRAEILFDISRQVFYFSLSFSEERLQKYETNLCDLVIQSNHESEAESIQINRSNFAPDNPVRFPLKLTSNSCIISITSRCNPQNRIRSYYEILKQIEFPTFFKVHINDDGPGIAKRHTDGIIYTDTQYYVLAKQQDYIEKLLKYTPEISLGHIERIEALGGFVFGATVTISSISKKLKDTLEYFGYFLKKAERFTALWPPIYSVDGVFHCNAKNLFLSSSFELQPKSNISCGPEMIEQFDNIYRVDISEPIRISKTNNTTTQILFDESTLPTNSLEPSIEHVSVVGVLEDETTYRIGCTGYCMLCAGQHYLTKDTKIVRYLRNYSKTIYLPLERPKIPPIRILRNIRRYYKVMVPFEEKMIADCHLSKVAEIYVEDCRKTGIINRKALEYIRAGKI